MGLGEEIAMGPDLVTMLHTSLSAKKSSPVNCKLFTAPLLSKKNGSVRRPAQLCLGGAK
jgi:hypothetical protein